MQISKFSDYALRTLMHLAVAKDQLLTTKQIAEIHDAKYNHLSKVTHWLSVEGLIKSTRGRTGGISLNTPAKDIDIGDLLRKLENQDELVECMRPDGGKCVLAPRCGLTKALIRAQDAFYGALNGTSLADLANVDSEMANFLLFLNKKEGASTST